MLLVILVVANSIGSIPIVIALALKTHSDPTISSQFAANPGNMSLLGLSPIMGFIALMIPFITGLLAFVLLIKPLNNRTFKAVINGTSKIRWNRFFISGLVWFLLSAIYFFIYLKFDPSNFTINSKYIFNNNSCFGIRSVHSFSGGSGRGAFQRLPDAGFCSSVKKQMVSIDHDICALWSFACI